MSAQVSGQSSLMGCALQADGRGPAGARGGLGRAVSGYGGFAEEAAPPRSNPSGSQMEWITGSRALGRLGLAQDRRLGSETRPLLTECFAG